MPTFVFPEESDAYFCRNANALQLTLSNALQSGCLDSWSLTSPLEIAIVFRYDSIIPDTSDYYIQFQMEQVAATAIEEPGIGFSGLLANVEYKRQLEEALLVWEWSPHNLKFLRHNLQGAVTNRLEYVPLWSSVDIDSEAPCETILEELSCQAEQGVDVLFFWIHY